MPEYLSPGVYVEEVPSAVQPIAGVGTSTAGFIGVFDADTLVIPSRFISGEIATPVEGANDTFRLGSVAVQANGATVRVNNVERSEGVTLATAAGVSTVKLAPAPDAKAIVTVDYQPSFEPAKAGDVRLCTNFGEFSRAFGGFSTDPEQRLLAHAVYGFFANGGSRCFVVREKGAAAVASSALAKFAAIDEIAIVAAPGQTDDAIVSALVTHCRIETCDRFAILDGPETTETAGNFAPAAVDPPPNSDYAAFYVPWLRVFDPATKLTEPKGSGVISVPPSGHMAGIYARVDTERGVHKAPANEVVASIVGLRYNISKGQQDLLNPRGVNVIRNLNGAPRVWGARTLGGDANGEWRYINTRRLFLFLRESIDEGTQWVVFEPNDASLWAKITRNVTAFLTNVWRSGALFGATPAEAFYVKCDAETNPPEVREAGQVVTEIGVAVVRPAEFVIFRISQWGGPGQ